MARVRGVMSESSRSSSILRVSGRISAKTGRAPRSTKLVASVTKAKDGTMNSSPGSIPRRRAAISRA